MTKLHIEDSWIGQEVVLSPAYRGALTIKGTLEDYGEQGVQVQLQLMIGYRSSNDGGQTWTDEGIAPGESRSVLVPWDQIAKIEPI